MRASMKQTDTRKAASVGRITVRFFWEHLMPRAIQRVVSGPYAFAHANIAAYKTSLIPERLRKIQGCIMTRTCALRMGTGGEGGKNTKCVANKLDAHEGSRVTVTGTYISLLIHSLSCATCSRTRRSNVSQTGCALHCELTPDECRTCSACMVTFVTQPAQIAEVFSRNAVMPQTILLSSLGRESELSLPYLSSMTLSDRTAHPRLQRCSISVATAAEQMRRKWRNCCGAEKQQPELFSGPHTVDGSCEQYRPA
nr:hypothetical protein CFP56_00498 [Quercus suber]